MVFQFLVGRLKTQIEFTPDGTFRMFQFLVGRLKTFNKPEAGIFWFGFQFLVGRLKTHVIMTGWEKDV